MTLPDAAWPAIGAAVTAVIALISALAKQDHERRMAGLSNPRPLGGGVVLLVIVAAVAGAIGGRYLSGFFGGSPSTEPTPNPSVSVSATATTDPPPPTPCCVPPSPTPADVETQVNDFQSDLRQMLDTHKEDPDLLSAFYVLPITHWFEYRSQTAEELAERSWRERDYIPGPGRWTRTCSDDSQTLVVAVTIPTYAKANGKKGKRLDDLERTYTLTRVANDGQPFRVTAGDYGLCP